MSVDQDTGTVPGPAVLDPDANQLVVINTYEVLPDRAEALLEHLARATSEVLRHVPGFVSANFHLNADHTRIVNYAQWRDRASLEAARDFPGVKERIGEAAGIATSFSPVQYELRSSIAAGG